MIKNIKLQFFLNTKYYKLSTIEYYVLVPEGNCNARNCSGYQPPRSHRGLHAASTWQNDRIFSMAPRQYPRYPGAQWDSGEVFLAYVIHFIILQKSYLLVLLFYFIFLKIVTLNRNMLDLNKNRCLPKPNPRYESDRASFN